MFAMKKQPFIQLAQLSTLLAEGVEIEGDIVFSSGMRIDVHTDDLVVSLLAGKTQDIVQFAREAISNAVRHSEAKQVNVSLLASGDAALLEVSDDGIGFDVEHAEGRGHGLANLRARAEALGGEPEIESQPNAGTWVRVRIPL